MTFPDLCILTDRQINHDIKNTNCVMCAWLIGFWCVLCHCVRGAAAATKPAFEMVWHSAWSRAHNEINLHARPFKSRINTRIGDESKSGYITHARTQNIPESTNFVKLLMCVICARWQHNVALCLANLNCVASLLFFVAVECQFI